VTNQLTFQRRSTDVDHFEYDEEPYVVAHHLWIIQTQNQSAMYFTDVFAGRSALIIPFRWSVLAQSVTAS
jgi:hypothetical protein